MSSIGLWSRNVWRGWQVAKSPSPVTINVSLVWPARLDAIFWACRVTLFGILLLEGVNKSLVNCSCADLFNRLVNLERFPEDVVPPWQHLSFFCSVTPLGFLQLFTIPEGLPNPLYHRVFKWVTVCGPPWLMSTRNCAFSAVGLILWNPLPVEVRQVLSLLNFQHPLKTLLSLLFLQAF